MDDNIDTLGIKKSLDLFPDQIRTTYQQALVSNIERLDFDSVVISGMGGSSNAGKIIQSLVEGESPIPITVFNDYGLPGWVNSKTLVVLNSYSGNTEETLSAYGACKGKGIDKIIGVTTGGKIAELITANQIKGAIVVPGETNPSNFPKSGLGISFGALLGALTKVGLIKTTETDLNLALAELIKIRETWKAEDTAKWLDGYMPILLSGRPSLGPLNAGRNAMCEISRNFTQFYDFPEVDHVLVEATQKPQAARNSVRYLFFLSKFNNPRVLTRYKVTAKIFEEQGLVFNDFVLTGSTKLAQALELPHFCAWVGFYLSLLQNTDPGPEPWIIKLKEALAQPTH